MSSKGKGLPMSPRFEGRVAIVTGSGGGIGEAYARALHAEGARVVIAELDAERGQAVADDLGEGALFVPTDVGDPASTDAMATATVDAFGRIDHLVNNAAIFGDMELAGLTTVDYDYLDRFLQVNMLGALHCTRSTMGPMGEVGGGSIVNQSSTASWMGIAGFYGLAKAGLNFLTSSLAHELGTTSGSTPSPPGRPGPQRSTGRCQRHSASHWWRASPSSGSASPTTTWARCCSCCRTRPGGSPATSSPSTAAR
jgi:NADP-dependent 3-hydroxy acid dehydrogenase YdfG